MKKIECIIMDWAGTAAGADEQKHQIAATRTENAEKGYCRTGKNAALHEKRRYFAACQPASNQRTNRRTAKICRRHSFRNYSLER